MKSKYYNKIITILNSNLPINLSLRTLLLRVLIKTSFSRQNFSNCKFDFNIFKKKTF